MNLTACNRCGSVSDGDTPFETVRLRGVDLHLCNDCVTKTFGDFALWAHPPQFGVASRRGDIVRPPPHGRPADEIDPCHAARTTGAARAVNET